MRNAITYPELAMRAVEATRVPELLARHPTGALVLERVARGGGATRWFLIRGEEQLPMLASRLSPGSSVSFYFDERLQSRAYGADVGREILQIAEQDRDAVVGKLGEDEFELEVEFIASQEELDEFVESLIPKQKIFYGRFPPRENDGERAVTVDLPDRDGVVRPHPH